MPTASESRGWGSGAFDLAAGALFSWHQKNWFGHLEGWLVQPLAKDEPGLRYSIYPRGSFTPGYQLQESVSIIVQAQGGNSPYHANISILDRPPFLIAFGLRGELESGAGWTLTIVENISLITTQDISIAIGYHWSFR